MRQIQAESSACAAWLERVTEIYALPRAALIRMLDRPGALEYEIAKLISDTAWQTARRLLDDRERPDDGADLFSRAVLGCYQQLRDREIARSAAVVKEVFL